MSDEPTSLQFTLSKGHSRPFGATGCHGGVNFSVYVKNAFKVIVVLFKEQTTPGEEAPEIAAIPLNKTGEVWHVRVEGLPDTFDYAYRVTFPEDPEKSLLLADPYAKIISSGSTPESYFPRGRMVTSQKLDPDDDFFPRIPFKDLVIYEMHVRGFTKSDSSGVGCPGTFAGIVEKIPYLKELGINAVELLPIHEFNENEVLQVNPETGKRLCNYFGYSTMNFFSPTARYAFRTDRDSAVSEFKAMVKELHKNGIEVILDVVYNHTGEGNRNGPTLSFKGLDKSAYYMIDPEGNYLNFSGCGNTFHSNHPVTQELILDSLRYWVTEMHVDGFRFDLASILTRSGNGTPLSPSPIVEAISLDPVLADTKLIAEAWDAAGLYQVGSFYPGSRWAEWNGQYRDNVRRFIKGTSGYKTAFADSLCGSQNLYGWRGTPCCSVNFVTAHDGFSLADLVTYNEKHNEANGEGNKDGFDHNDSWNCGIEGHSSNKRIVYLRERQIRNFHLALMVSQGVPMILMGDEYAHTRNGNNNTWCQDNELNWFLWNRLDVRPGFLRFFRSMIHYRKNRPLLKNEKFLTEKDIVWHGLTPHNPAWDNDNRLVAFSLNRPDQGPELYIAFNASHNPLNLTLPAPDQDKQWHGVVNTHNLSPEDFIDEENRLPLPSNAFRIQSYSAILLEASPVKNRPADFPPA